MLRPGDLIIFSWSGNPDHLEDEIVGLVVSREHDEGDSPAVMVRFYDRNRAEGPLHYYDHELIKWLKEGVIRIQNAS